MKAGPTQAGDMAFDDVMLTDAQCPLPGRCDFEVNMCSWSNLGGVDEEDWLRGRGNSANPNTGPGVDHTTNSSQGKYMLTSILLLEYDITDRNAVTLSGLLHASSPLGGKKSAQVNL